MAMKNYASQARRVLRRHRSPTSQGINILQYKHMLAELINGREPDFTESAMSRIAFRVSTLGLGECAFCCLELCQARRMGLHHRWYRLNLHHPTRGL